MTVGEAVRAKRLFATTVIFILMNVSGLCNHAEFNTRMFCRPKLVTGSLNDVAKQFAYHSFAGDIRYVVEDTLKRSSADKKPYTRKSPALAFGLGFFPGSAIHGLGHYYIGENRTAGTLILVEIFSILLIHQTNWPGMYERNGFNPGSADVFEYMGIVLFIGTWAFDSAIAPLEAARLNKEHELSIRVYPRVRDDLASINIALTF